MTSAQVSVGIDVSKAQLDIALRPEGRFAASNDDAGFAQIIERLRAVPPALVVLEATGGLEVPLTGTLTGGDGQAFLSYRPKAKGALPFTVRAGTTPRVAVAEAGANLAVWERRSPIKVVEMASLMEDAVGQGPTVT
jgi:hypothetical protein